MIIPSLIARLSALFGRTLNPPTFFNEASSWDSIVSVAVRRRARRARTRRRAGAGGGTTAGREHHGELHRQDADDHRPELRQ